jgi:hypothetical protein
MQYSHVSCVCRIVCCYVVYAPLEEGKSWGNDHLKLIYYRFQTYKLIFSEQVNRHAQIGKSPNKSLLIAILLVNVARM